jgi:hypothetical protein
MKTETEWRASDILDLVTGLMSVVMFVAWPSYLWYPLVRRFGGPFGWSGWFGEEKMIMLGIIYRFHSFCFDFHTVHFVLCLGITNKCVSSYQFIISLSCSYMFRQLCAILRELVCTFWVTCQFGFWLIK